MIKKLCAKIKRARNKKAIAHSQNPTRASGAQSASRQRATTATVPSQKKKKKALLAGDSLNPHPNTAFPSTTPTTHTRTAIIKALQRRRELP